MTDATVYSIKSGSKQTVWIFFVRKIIAITFAVQIATIFMFTSAALSEQTLFPDPVVKTVTFRTLSDNSLIIQQRDEIVSNISTHRQTNIDKFSTMGFRVNYASSFSLKNKTSPNHLNFPLNNSDARHLISRTGFGVHPEELNNILGKSRRAAIEQILKDLKATTPSLPYPNFMTRDFVPSYWLKSNLLEQDKRLFNELRDQEMSSLKLWWLQEMISTPKPQAERLNLLWHNHFVSSYDQMDHETHAIAYKHLKIRKLGHGNFRKLAKAMLLDAAILKYLNNDTNRSGSPNENLARELLELFILGEGNYDEDTVREVSRALTGYGYNKLRRFEVEFRPWDHDFNDKTIFSQKSPIKGAEVIDILLEREDAARHITTIFWKFYISEFNFDDSEIERIANIFYHSDYEIPVLLREILSSKAFWDHKNRKTIIKSPIDLIIGTIRSSGQFPRSFTNLPHQAARLGQNLFEQPNVAGWSGGTDWITPNRLLMRSDLLKNLASELSHQEVEGNQGSEEATTLSGNNSFIYVRYAAEHFEGAPIFTLEAINRKNGTSKKVWTSSPQTAQVGTETSIFGRVRYKDLIWTIAKIPIPTNLTFNEINIKFLNDRCCGASGPTGGDRNLFIDWVSFKNKIAYARQGLQNTCNNDEADKIPGRMYCSGTLYLRDFQSSFNQETEHLNFANDVLIVGETAFIWADKGSSDRDWNGFRVGLSGLSFIGHSKVSMEFSIFHHIQNGSPRILLVFQDHNCYPSCFTQPFPVSSFRDKHRANKSLRIVLSGKETKREAEQWAGLNHHSRVLVSIIAMNLRTIIEGSKQGRHWRDRGGDERLKNWNQVFDKLDQELEVSKYAQLQKGYHLQLTPKRLMSPHSERTDSKTINSPSIIAGLSIDAAKLTQKENIIFLNQLHDPLYQLK